MRGVCAASVIQDTSVKNTKHSRSGVVCEIWLFQKKVNTDEDGDTGQHNAGGSLAPHYQH